MCIGGTLRTAKRHGSWCAAPTKIPAHFQVREKRARMLQLLARVPRTVIDLPAVK
jgi:hypothetical protein